MLRWQLDPILIGTLIALATVYGIAVGPLRERIAPGVRFPIREAWLFASALLITFLAEGSPLHDLAEVYLFSAHMAQHLILSYIVAPLLIAGTPTWIWRRLLLARGVRPVFRVLTQPVAAFLVFSLAFSLWHVPAVYEGALRNSFVHHVEHVVFIGTAILVWWPVMSSVPEMPRLGYGLRILYIAALPLGQFIVSAFLALSSTPFYETYSRAPRITALTPQGDQQLGGVIMKVGSFIAFAIPLAYTFFRWYARERSSTSPSPKKRAS